MQLSFWLLEISVKTPIENPEICLWGIDENGARLLVIDRTFIDYFYVVIDDDYDSSKVGDQIKAKYQDSIVKIENESKKFFGKPVKALKIYCINPAEIAKGLRDFEGVKNCLEDDIRLTMKYLINNNIDPCTWIQLHVEEESNNSSLRIERVYSAKSLPKPKKADEKLIPKLRILNFHMQTYNPEGSPKPKRNPVILIATVTNDGKERLFKAKENGDDKELLQDFINYIKSYDPDILAGYKTNTTYLEYLRERCKHLDLKLQIDRKNSEPHRSIYGHMSLTGMINLDIADYMDLFPDVKVKTLENLADHIGIMSLEKRTTIMDIEVANYWNDNEKRKILEESVLDNARSVKGITDALLEFSIQLSSLVSLPLDHVMTIAVGFRVDWFLIKWAQKIGELIPKRTDQSYRPYTGGVVLQPKPGLHNNIAVLDFKSMYPNLMIFYNLSPDTYISPDKKIQKTEYNQAPEVNHRFKKQPPGFFKQVLTYLINVRKEINSTLHKIDKNDIEYRILDARQKAIKIITNATYGYAGWTAARWYSKPVAEAATAYGRNTIMKATNMAKQNGLNVIYGDTDSLFVTFDKKKTPLLEKQIEDEFGLEVEQEKIYTRIFFTEAKKRYAGLLPDGSLDIVGLEVIRGDWAEVAKKVQEKVLEIILKDQSPEKAKEYVHKLISETRNKEIPFKDLIIWKTISKPIKRYAVNASHVEVAKQLKARGWKISTGDKVGYVIVKGEGRLFEKAKPYKYTQPEEIDDDYYINKQIIPAAARILSFFNITEEELLNEEKQGKTKNLMDFMKP